MLVRVPTLALLACLAPGALAHAGDGGGTTSSSSDATSSDATGGTSDASTSDATSTDGTSTSASSSTSDTSQDDTAADTSDGGCGSCPTGDESVTFDTPTDGATVDAPFAVVVDIVPRCPCFDCSCAAEEPEYVQLFLDTVAWAGPCYVSPCAWEVTVSEPDEFLLTARAHYPSGDASTSVVVQVASVTGGSTGYDPTMPSDDGPEPTTSGPAGTMPAKSDDGCGCASDRSPGAAGVLPLCLLLSLVSAARTRRR